MGGQYMGILHIALPWKWVGVVIFGILSCNLCENSDAAFQCSNNTTDCSCVTVTVPQRSRTILSNTDISLECNVTYTTGDEVQWIKGAVPLGTDPTIPGESRYSMNTTSYSLIISNVQLSDQSSYSCQVVDCLIISANAEEITVYVLPSVPVVANASDDGTVDVVATDVTSLECSTSNGIPTPSIGWFNTSGSDPLASNEVKIADPDSETIIYKSTFTFTPSIYDNDQKLYCGVGGDAVLLTGEISLNTIITLNVISKPSTFLLIGANSGGILIIDFGSSASIACNATGTESGSKLTWDRNGEQLPTSYSEESMNGINVLSSNLYISGAGENDGATYQCTVEVPGKTRNYQESLGFTVSIYEFPLGWVIGGSLLGLFLIIALIIIIVCCISRRKGKETKLSDSTPESLPQQEVAENPATLIEADDPVIERVDTTTESAQQQAAEFVSSSDTDTEYTTVEREMDVDEISVNLPDGEVFSLSSSVMRSDRGSPVPNDRDMEDDNSASDGEPYTVLTRSRKTFYV